VFQLRLQEHGIKNSPIDGLLAGAKKEIMTKLP